MSTEKRTTEEHLDRIKSSLFVAGDVSTALESLAALREQVAEMERDDVTLRRRIHQIEEHNQFFERCESGWCNPDAAADPASRGVGAAWKTPAEYDQQIATLTAERDEARADCKKFRKWANCSGVSAGKACSVDGHEIYGPFFTDAADVATCELHGYRRLVQDRDERIATLESARDAAVERVDVLEGVVREIAFVDKYAVHMRSIARAALSAPTPALQAIEGAARSKRRREDPDQNTRWDGGQGQ